MAEKENETLSSSIMASNVFSIDLFNIMESTIPSNIPELINGRSLEEDFRVYSSVLDGLSDEQAFNYLERNIEINEIFNSNECFIEDIHVLNYLEKMKSIRRNILENHDLLKIHEEEDESAFHYYLLEEYLFSSPEYVKKEINSLSKFNKIRKFIGLAIDPNEKDFDESNFRELK